MLRWITLAACLAGCAAEQSVSVDPGEPGSDAGVDAPDGLADPPDAGTGLRPGCPQVPEVEQHALPEDPTLRLAVSADHRRAVLGDGRVWGLADQAFEPPAEVVPILASAPQPVGDRLSVRDDDGGLRLVPVDHPGPALALPGEPWRTSIGTRHLLWRVEAGLYAFDFQTWRGGLLPDSTCAGAFCDAPWVVVGDALYYLSSARELIRAIPGGASERVGQTSGGNWLAGGARTVAYPQVVDGEQVVVLESGEGRQVFAEPAASEPSYSGRFGSGDVVFASRWGPTLDDDRVRVVRTADGVILWEGAGRASLSDPDRVLIRTDTGLFWIDVADGRQWTLPGAVGFGSVGPRLLFVFFEDGSAWLVPRGEEQPLAQAQFEPAAEVSGACTHSGRWGVCVVGQEAVVIDLEAATWARRFTLAGGRIHRIRLLRGGGLALYHRDAEGPTSVLLPPYDPGSQWLLPAEPGRDRHWLRATGGECPVVSFVDYEGDFTQPRLTIWRLPTR